MDRNILIKLQKDRKEMSKQLQKRCVRAVKDRITNQYDEDAHFIYELIQNANDAKAENMTFILTKNCIITLHDGSKDFTVTDPDDEDSDTINGKLGDLNSLLSIGNSNKPYEGNKIGKFGCGFKSVFRYTNTAIIFNKDLKIKITDYISFDFCTTEEENSYRNLIRREASHASQNNDYDNQFSTIMILPFDKEGDDLSKVHADISKMLRSLRKPVLFLDNLKNIVTISDGAINSYWKTEEVINTASDIELLFIKYSDLGKSGYCWKVSRETADLNKYSVVYETNEFKNKLIPCIDKVFYCFFETRTPNNKQYIANGSFELNPARTNIKEGARNEELKIRINELSIDALDELARQKAYGDEIIYYYPDYINNNYQRFLNLVQTSAVIPCGNGEYGILSNSNFIIQKISNIFSDDDVKNILNIKNNKIAFPTVYSSQFDEKTLNKQEFKSIKIDFIKVVEKINSEFMQEKFLNNKLWLENLYEKMTKLSKDDCDCLKKAPIFLTNNDEWVPFDNEIYIDEEQLSECKCINIKLLNISEKVKEILGKWFKKYSAKDLFDSKLNKFDYSNKLSLHEANQEIMYFYKRYFSVDDTASFLRYKLEHIKFIRCRNGEFYSKNDVVYYTDPLINDIYPSSIIVDREYYFQILKNKFPELEDEQISNLVNGFFKIFLDEISDIKLFSLIVSRFRNNEIDIDEFNKIVIKFYTKIQNKTEDVSLFKNTLKTLEFIKCKNGKIGRINHVIYVKEDNLEQYYPDSVLIDKIYYKNLVKVVLGGIDKKQINKVVYGLFDCFVDKCNDSHYIKILVNEFKDGNFSIDELNLLILYYFEKCINQPEVIDTLKSELYGIQFIKNKDARFVKKDDVFYTKDSFLEENYSPLMMVDKNYYKHIIKNKFVIGDKGKQTDFLYKFFDCFTRGDNIEESFLEFVDYFRRNLVSYDQFNIVLLFLYISYKEDDILVDFLKRKVLKLKFIKCKDGSYNEKMKVVCTNDPLWQSIYSNSILVDEQYYVNIVNTSLLHYAHHFSVNEFIENFISYRPYRSLDYDLPYFSPCRILVDGFDPSIIDCHEDFFVQKNSINIEHTILGLPELVDTIVQKANNNLYSKSFEAKDKSVKLFNVIKYFIKDHNNINISDIFYLHRFKSSRSNFSISGLAIYPLFLSKSSAFLKHCYDRNISELNEIYDLSDLNSHQISDLADFLKMNNDFGAVSIPSHLLDKALKKGWTVKQMENYLCDCLSSKLQDDDVDSNAVQSDSEIDDASAECHSHQNMRRNIGSVSYDDEGACSSDAISADNADTEAQKAPQVDGKYFTSPSSLNQREFGGGTANRNKSVYVTNPVFDESDNFIEGAHSLKLSFSSRASLPSEDRKKINKEVALPRAIEYLKSNGYKIDKISIDYTIIEHVFSSDYKTEYAVCAKSAQHGIVYITPAELAVRDRIGSANYMIFIYRDSDDYKFECFDEFWKQKELITMQFSTRDYNEKNMDGFFNAIRYLPGATCTINLSSVAPSYGNIKKLQDVENKVDNDYINKTKDSDEDF